MSIRNYLKFQSYKHINGRLFHWSYSEMLPKVFAHLPSHAYEGDISLSVPALIPLKGVLSGWGQDSVQASQVLPHQTRSSMSLWPWLCALGHVVVGTGRVDCRIFSSEESSRLDLLHRCHPITVPCWNSLSSWDLPHAVCMPRCLILYTCGDGSEHLNSMIWIAEWILLAIECIYILYIQPVYYEMLLQLEDCVHTRPFKFW